MWANIIITVLGGLLVAVLAPYIIKRIEKNKLFRNRFFYSLTQVNEMAREFDFTHCSGSAYLRDTELKELYPDAFTSVTLGIDSERKTVELPYKEVINFVKHPTTSITISSPRVEKKFIMRPELIEATKDVEAEFIKERKCKDEPHPRISSLVRVSENLYECCIEEASYFQQIRTNLTLDYPLEIKGVDGDITLRTYDQRPYKCLPEFADSCLSNTIGVSAIWMMGKPGRRHVFLLPRKKSVGIFTTKLGIPSGSVEMPKDSCFDTNSLVDFLTLDIAREFAEETGLCGKNIDINKFSKPVPKPTMIEHMEIIPLAFVRELLRGGKPQMFFLILTPEIPIKTLKKSFRRSLGTEEFDNSLLTKAIPSSETMCNYIYALKYLNKNSDLPFLSI